jgi:peptide/nickel transport system substrate-binding protein
MTFFVYAIVTGIIFFNFNKIIGSKADSTGQVIVEALLYPKGVPNVSEVFHIDPLLSATENESVVEVRKGISFLIFSSLFKENLDGSMTNDIVESYQFTQAKNLTFKIKDNIFWHDGQKLTTDDILFTLNQIRALGQNGLYFGAVNGGDIDYKAVSSTEMAIDLTGTNGPGYNAAYLQELTFPILPKHLLQDYSQNQISSLSTSEYAKRPVGSGKLIYDEVNGSELVLVKNNRYYDKSVSFDQYRMRFYKDEEEIVKNYFLKNIDLYASRGIIEDKNLAERIARNSTAFTTILKDINYVLYFNLSENKQDKSPLLKSLSLRNGLQKIVNRENILKRLNNSTRQVFGPIDQSSWAFNPEVQEEQKLNIEEFKKRAEAQGYILSEDYYKKENVTLGFTLSYLGGDIRDDIVNQIRDDMKLAGVEVKLDQINKTETSSTDETGTLNIRSTVSNRKISDIINNRDFEALLSSVNQNQDPDRYSQWHSPKNDGSPSLNISTFDSNVADLMLAQGRTEPDQAVRKERYLRFQRTFIQDVPAIYLVNHYNINYHSKRLSLQPVEIINGSEYRYQNLSEWKVQ